MKLRLAKEITSPSLSALIFLEKSEQKSAARGEVQMPQVGKGKRKRSEKNLLGACRGTWSVLGKQGARTEQALGH